MIPTQQGPFVYVDGSGLRDADLKEVPHIVARRLVEAGLDDAHVVSPAFGGPLDELGDVPRAVTLHVGVQPGQSHKTLHSEWLQVADEWLRTAAPSGEAWVNIRSVQFNVGTSEVLDVFRSLAAAGESGLAVSGDLASRVAGMNVEHKVHPHLVFGCGGPEASDDELLRAAAQFKDLARRLAPKVGYAFIALEPTLFSLWLARPRRDSPSPDALPDVVWRLSDRLVLDAFGWQILGPGHVARLGFVPEGATPIPGGRFELALGDLADWLPARPEREQRRAAGRQLLSACLLNQKDAMAILLARR